MSDRDSVPGGEAAALPRTDEVHSHEQRELVSAAPPGASGHADTVRDALVYYAVGGEEYDWLDKAEAALDALVALAEQPSVTCVAFDSNGRQYETVKLLGDKAAVDAVTQAVALAEAKPGKQLFTASADFVSRLERAERERDNAFADIEGADAEYQIQREFADEQYHLARAAEAEAEKYRQALRHIADGRPGVYAAAQSFARAALAGESA